MALPPGRLRFMAKPPLKKDDATYCNDVTPYFQGIIQNYNEHYANFLKKRRVYAFL